MTCGGIDCPHDPDSSWVVAGIATDSTYFSFPLFEIENPIVTGIALRAPPYKWVDWETLLFDWETQK